MLNFNIDYLDHLLKEIELVFKPLVNSKEDAWFLPIYYQLNQKFILDSIGNFSFPFEKVQFKLKTFFKAKGNKILKIFDTLEEAHRDNSSLIELFPNDVFTDISTNSSSVGKENIINDNVYVSYIELVKYYSIENLYLEFFLYVHHNYESFVMNFLPALSIISVEGWDDDYYENIVNLRGKDINCKLSLKHTFLIN